MVSTIFISQKLNINNNSYNKGIGPYKTGLKSKKQFCYGENLTNIFRSITYYCLAAVQENVFEFENEKNRNMSTQQLMKFNCQINVKQKSIKMIKISQIVKSQFIALSYFWIYLF